MTKSLPLPAPGWYPDGVTPGVLRWFDGAAWTERVVRDPAAPPVPPATTVPAVPARAVTRAPDPGPAPVHADATAGPHVPVWTRPNALAATGPYAPAATGPYAPAATGPYSAAPAPAPASWAPPPPRRGSHPRDVLHWVLPVGRSWQSVAAGYVGLLALGVWVLGPVAIGFGIAAVVAGSRGGHGRGRAVFALLSGVVATVLALAVLLGVPVVPVR
jgi:hypothetical protein